MPFLPHLASWHSIEGHTCADKWPYLTNKRFLQEAVYERVLQFDMLQHVILLCSPENDIQKYILESLDVMNEQLKSVKISRHNTEACRLTMDNFTNSQQVKGYIVKVVLGPSDALNKFYEDDFDTELEYFL